MVCVPGEAAVALEKYRVVAASAVIATGALYVLLGLCCCRGIRRGAQLRYRRRLAHAELQRAYLAERAHGPDASGRGPKLFVNTPAAVTLG